MNKILVLGFKFPYPVTDGGDYAMFSDLKALSQLNDTTVTFLCLNTNKQRVENPKLPFGKGIEVLTVDINTKLNLKQILTAVKNKNTVLAQRFYSRTFEETLIELLASKSFDSIILEHLYLGVYLNTIKQKFTNNIVLRAQNVEHQLWKTISKHEKNLVKRIIHKFLSKQLYRFETDTLNKVDKIIALTEADEVVFKSLTNKPLDIIPLAYEQSNEPKNELSKSKFYHLASMDWTPNKQGVSWFFEEIAPKLLHQNIDLTFAGKHMPKKHLNQSQFPCASYIKDKKAFLKDKNVLIVPLLSGGGIKVKIIEALSLGMCVISTKEGIKGFNLTHNKNVLIAHNETEFANLILKVNTNYELRNRIGKGGQKYAKLHFSYKQIGNKLLTFCLNEN